MSVNILFGDSDQVLDEIIPVLEQYQADHVDAQIDIYRQNPASIRVRIVNPAFAKLGRPQRHDAIWKYLDNLDEETQQDISMLLLLTPDESQRSFANFEFNDPVPSKL